MLRYTYLILSFFVLLALSCDEIPPILNPNNGGGGGISPVEEQTRQVLIEEFTGVHCVNCPAGSQAIEVLLDIHGQNLVAVSIHAGFFATPYPESQQDLATTAGNSILSSLGDPAGFPTAVVNRHHFEGEDSRQLAQSSWAGYIAQEQLSPPQVKIDLQTTFNETTRQLTLDVDLYIEEDITEDDVRLSLYLTENNIIDLQETPDSVQTDYVHKHVFRDAISATNGDLINENLTANSVISRSYTYTLDNSWVASECHVIGFVHLGGSTLNVFQAHEVTVIE